MSFTLSGIVGAPSVAARLGAADDVVALREGFAMRLLPEAVLLDGKPLPDPLAAAAAEASIGGAVAYLESEHFGGRGAEAAVGWRDGELALGPLRTQSPGEGFDGFDEVADVSEGAVNAALRWLGVARGDHRTEFDALGLGERRDWGAGGG